MLTRDSYIRLLEKRASDDVLTETNAQHEASRADGQHDLKGLFARAGEVQKNQSSTVNRLFSGPAKNQETSTVLLKLAMAQLDSCFMKVAGEGYRQVAMNSFRRELEKIAAASAIAPWIGMPKPRAGFVQSAGPAPGVLAKRLAAQKAPKSSGLFSRLMSGLSRA